jgi:hypothetical protein
MASLYIKKAVYTAMMYDKKTKKVAEKVILL